MPRRVLPVEQTVGTVSAVECKSNNVIYREFPLGKRDYITITYPPTPRFNQRKSKLTRLVLIRYDRQAALTLLAPKPGKP